MKVMMVRLQTADSTFYGKRVIKTLLLLVRVQRRFFPPSSFDNFVNFPCDRQFVVGYSLPYINFSLETCKHVVQGLHAIDVGPGA